MELWREQMLLEQTNLTRDGTWLELVKRKVERKAEATAARPALRAPSVLQGDGTLWAPSPCS